MINVRKKYREWILLIRSQLYNEFFDFSYFIDTLLSPAFWFIDNWTGFIGPGFVIGVYFLTFLVVLFAYRIGIPYYWSLNPIFCSCLIIIGHWILINVIFNYVMAVITKPGYPPPINSSKIYSICKKCFNSKPARTHHCSICDRCILKMDHHCPWINNCVGFYNYRYFYLYMVYLLIGVVFLTIFGCHLAIDLIFYDDQFEENEDQIEGYVININDIKEEIFLTSIINDFMTHTLPYFKKLIIYVALIVCGVLISISYFVYYHGMLITKGETAIEELINKKERTRLENMNCIFENPYDFGFSNNWRLFFGIKKHQSFVRHILLPSKYQPLNDGINWPTIYNCDINKFLS